MNSRITDEGSKAIIEGLYTLIESALKCGRTHMKGSATCRPETVDSMLRLIQSVAARGQEWKWPDPAARLADAAGKDAALQKLIKRASKPTPIRARQAKQGGAA